MKTVLVTGVGGGVGQGILRNLRAEQFPITLFGIYYFFRLGLHFRDLAAAEDRAEPDAAAPAPTRAG